MKILFTGKSDFKYNRTAILLQGLEQHPEIEVVKYPITKRRDFDVHEFKRIQDTVDWIYIPPFRHGDVSFIKKWATKPIVFDPLISKYLTKVVDYGHFWKAPMKYFLDRIPFKKADLLIADTQCHKEMFSQLFGVSLSSIEVLPIGADTEVYAQAPVINTDGKFHVGFYGTFVPLQGVSKIIECAKILEGETDIVFDIIGTGYEHKKILKLIDRYSLSNVNMMGWVKYNELPQYMSRFNICLGIFGDSKKADAVIPNKMYHYAALGKCVITKDTTGIKEMFTNGENAILCKNDPVLMAQQITELKSAEARVERIGKNARELMVQGYTPHNISDRFIRLLRLHQPK